MYPIGKPLNFAFIANRVHLIVILVRVTEYCADPIERDTVARMLAFTHTLSIRLDDAQYRDLEQLERKLHIDKTNVIRLALTRMAESELIERKFRKYPDAPTAIDWPCPAMPEP